MDGKYTKLIMFNKRPFREHHLLQIINGYSKQNLPLDLYICQYFRANKALGPKDRGMISDTIYTMVRWQGLLDAISTQPPSWEKRLDLILNDDLSRYENDLSLPLHIRLSFPKELFDRMVASHGEETAKELCRISNQPAPTTIRVNTLKTSRNALLERWQNTYDISPCKTSECGILFHKKINFFSLPEFQEGLFEVQDEGSQLLSNLIQAQPGQQVMDYCAGSGGKTLAFAPRMQGKGQIFLHDIRSHALLEARKRLKRAGIQNAQTISADDPKLNKLKKKMDWVLVDAPCSGSGTMRRNPDMKWHYSDEMLTRLVGQQRVIFEKALSYLKADGHIVYATCSFLNEENEKQVEHFMKTYDLHMEGDPFRTLPTVNGMDGFYCAVLKKWYPQEMISTLPKKSAVAYDWKAKEKIVD